MDIPSELTEQYIIDHTDMYLGTVALHAAQVRTVLHQNAAMKKLLIEIRPVLDALWHAERNHHSADLSERITKVVNGDLS